MSTETTPLHITREGPRSFIGRNARGAEVRIGGSDADGVFSPGELLHLALAACGMLSSDHILASRLGADFEATTDITATKPSDIAKMGLVRSFQITSLYKRFTVLDNVVLAVLARRASAPAASSGSSWPIRSCTMSASASLTSSHRAVSSRRMAMPQRSWVKSRPVRRSRSRPLDSRAKGRRIAASDVTALTLSCCSIATQSEIVGCTVRCRPG